jgi:hypothetical protein
VPTGRSKDGQHVDFSSFPAWCNELADVGLNLLPWIGKALQQMSLEETFDSAICKVLGHKEKHSAPELGVTGYTTTTTCERCKKIVGVSIISYGSGWHEMWSKPFDKPELL